MADLFNALPEAGSKTFFDLTEATVPLYYARFHDPITGESHVLPEVGLADFFKAVENDFKKHIPAPFLGFYDDLEEIWWPHGDDEKRIAPIPEGVVGITTAQHIEPGQFERSKIVFFAVQKAPEGWVFPVEPGRFLVKPFREWILDYTFESQSESDPESDPEMVFDA